MRRDRAGERLFQTKLDVPIERGLDVLSGRRGRVTEAADEHRATESFAQPRHLRARTPQIFVELQLEAFLSHRVEPGPAEQRAG